MTVVETEGQELIAVATLADRIAEDLQRLTYRDLESRTGVSRGALEHIVKRRNRDYPTLETLDRLARYWNLPLADVIEMAGVNLRQRQDRTLEQRLDALIARDPGLAPLRAGLLGMRDADLAATIAYLEQAS